MDYVLFVEGRVVGVIKAKRQEAVQCIPLQKYIALNLEITVENEAERNTLYTALKHRAEINMVL